MSSDTNPAAPAEAAAPPISPEEAKQRAANAKRAAAAFGELVTLLMRSPTYRLFAIQDLEWLLVPPVLTGQFSIAEAQSRQTGATMPVAAVIWAYVSEDIDKMLSENVGQQVRLKPQDWRSGSIPWVIEAFGEPQVAGGLLRNLSQSVFKSTPAKIKVRDASGKLTVTLLEFKQDAPAA